MKQGGLFNNFNKALKDKLLKKGFDVIGEFNCLGFDTAGPLKAIGGLNKNRPNEKDLKKAQDFAREINNKIN
jgi:flavodoxin